MIDSHFRSPYQKYFAEPIAHRLTRLHPNFLTTLALLTGLSAAWLLNPILLLISGILDTLDGTLARLTNRCSEKGALFDLVSDRAVEAALVAGLLLVNPSTRAIPCLFMLASFYLCITTFLATEKSAGLIERFEAICFFLTLILFPTWFTPIAYTFGTLVFLTAAIRLYNIFTISHTVPHV